MAVRPYLPTTVSTDFRGRRAPRQDVGPEAPLERDEGSFRDRFAGGGAVVARTASDGEAEMVRQILSSNGIPCRIVSDVARPWPVSVAEARVLVPRDLRAEAARIIAEHRREGLRVVNGRGVSGDDEAESVTRKSGSGRP